MWHGAERCLRAACASQSRVRRRVGRIDLDGGAKRFDCIRQLEVRAREQVSAPAPHELVELDRAGRHARCWWLIIRCDAGDRRDEPISRPRHCFDEGWRPLVVAKRLAEGRDVYREDTFLDEGLRPDVREEFVLRDQMTRVPHQRDEDVKGFRRESDDSGAAQQLALGYVECAIAEMKCFAARHQLSANLSKSFGTPLPETRYGGLLSKGVGHGTNDGAGDSSAGGTVS